MLMLTQVIFCHAVQHHRGICGPEEQDGPCHWRGIGLVYSGKAPDEQFTVGYNKQRMRFPADTSSAGRA